MSRPDLPYSACWTLPDHVDRAAALWPDREALVLGGRRATFEQFADATFEFARGLSALGVEHGDSVGVLMSTGIDALVAVYGTSRLGAVAVALDERLTAAQLADVIAHADLRVLVSSSVEQVLEALPSAAGQDAGVLDVAEAPALRQIIRHGAGEQPECIAWPELRVLAIDIRGAEVRRAQRRLALDDTALLVYAPPGTTAQPRACRLSHEALVRTARVFAEQRFPMRDGDRQFNPHPLAGLGALLPFNGCLAVGAAFVGMERFEPHAALDLLARERCTVAFPAFDRVWAAVLDLPEFEATDLSRLRLVAVDGDPELIRATAERTSWLTQIAIYGTTESGGLIALSHLDDSLELRLGSAGRPFGGIEVRILDPASGGALGAGAPGQIAVRGWSLFQGYHKEPGGRNLDEDGFLHSGDLGALDGHGRLFHLGRIGAEVDVG